MEATPTPSPIWGNRDFFELVLFHFMLGQALLPSLLQSRCSVLNATVKKNKIVDDGEVTRRLFTIHVYANTQ
jgi:hypothetical protein